MSHVPDVYEGPDNRGDVRGPVGELDGVAVPDAADAVGDR